MIDRARQRLNSLVRSLRERIYGMLWRWLVRSYPKDQRMEIIGLGDVKQMLVHEGDLWICVDGKERFDAKK